MLIGNKCDLAEKRVVKPEDGLAYSQKNSMAFMETSALDSTNVDEAFEKIVGQIYEQTVRSSSNIKLNDQAVVGPSKKIETGEEKIIIQKTQKKKSTCC